MTYTFLLCCPALQAAAAYRYLAARDVPCLLYQDKYNLIDRAPDQTGLIDLAKENGAGFISFSPLQQGLLTNRYLNGIPEDSRMAAGTTSLKPSLLTEEMLASLRGLDAIARRRGQSLAQMALAWLLHDERVSSVIVGASSVAQLKDTVKATQNTAFTDEELLEIERISIHPDRI